MTDLHSLLLNWQSIDSDIHDLEIVRHHVEQQIDAEMAEQRATFAEAPGVEATLKPTVDYAKALDGPLAVIAEQLSPDELEGALTAQKPAPIRSFNMVQVKKLAKRGGIFRDALDAATLEQPARLRIRAVDSKK